MATRSKSMTTGPWNVVLHHLRADPRPGGDGPTDGELVARFVGSRDGDALATLVRRHSTLVWGVCCRLLHNHHDAEDAFQATFLVLVRKASVVPGHAVANWLYGVARQTAVRLRATAAKRGQRETQVTNVPETALPEVRVTDLRAVLDEELGRLPERYRGVIVVCDLEGMTRREAARQLGIPEGSVASRLARARVMLAKRLTKRGVVFSSGSVAVVSAPPALVASTITATALLTAGIAAAPGMISAQVSDLTEGVLKAMFPSKIKSVVGFLMLAMCLIGVGTAVVLATQPDTPKKTDPEAKQAKANETAVKAMQERLQGTWKCVFMHHNGVKSEPDMIHTIKGNSLECKLDGRVAQSCTFKLVDLDASPKQIDSLTTFADAEVVGERKDKTQRAIFMLDGDTLIMCVHDDERPKCFITQADDGCTMAQFKRVVAK